MSVLTTFEEAHAVRCELAAETLRTSGRLRLRVTGWSMFPSVRPGDTLMIERVELDSVDCGDIVLFERGGQLYVHRVVRKSGAKILTRGDAMPQADPEVEEQELLGRVRLILRHGERVEVRRKRWVGERIVGAVMGRWEFGARVVAKMHGMRVAVEPVA